MLWRAELQGQGDGALNPIDLLKIITILVISSSFPHCPLYKLSILSKGCNGLYIPSAHKLQTNT
jgi:hypothetical protein